MHRLFSNITILAIVLLISFHIDAVELGIYIENPEYKTKIQRVYKRIIKESLDDAINKFMLSNCALRNQLILYRDINTKAADYKDYITKKGEGIYIKTIVDNNNNLYVNLQFYYGNTYNIQNKNISIQIPNKNNLGEIKQTVESGIFSTLQDILRCKK